MSNNPKDNPNFDTHNNKSNNGECDRVSGSNRKILKAKRRGTNSRQYSHSHSSNHSSISTTITNVFTHGVKRSLSSEQPEQPPAKRLNSITTSNRTPSASPKNLAARRLHNLQQSLKRTREEDPNNSTPSGAKNIHKTQIFSNSPIDTRQFSPALNKSHSLNNLNNSPQQALISPIQRRLQIFKSPGQSKHETTTQPNSAIQQSLFCTAFTSEKIVNVQQERSVETNNTSIDNVVNSNNTINDDNWDEMEWLPVDDETVIENINEIRKEIDYSNVSPDKKEPENSNICPPLLENSQVYIVLDTNIFLSKLDVISRLKDIHFTGLGPAILVIPWMVVQELDYMKETNSSMSKGARRAVNFINDHLSKKHPQFKGQTVLEASKQELSSKNPDDGILFCCLQLAQQMKSVVLLSNDTNLRNKALINNIQAYHSTEIIQNLNKLKSVETAFTESNVKAVQKIKIVLSNLLTYIIQCEMKNAFGDKWKKMASMQKMQPPFTTEEALNCMKKYWQSVFSFSLQKQCLQRIEEFINFVKQRRHDDNYQTDDFNKFVEFTLSLCIYLKNGYTNYKDRISGCIKCIQEHAK